LRCTFTSASGSPSRAPQPRSSAQRGQYRPRSSRRVIWFFFHIHARAVDHVGIYSGGGRFIHAPRAGHAVEYADLYKGFYARRFVSAGRFW
jgi:hypothetical protein